MKASRVYVKPTGSRIGPILQNDYLNNKIYHVNTHIDFRAFWKVGDRSIPELGKELNLVGILKA